ncbi:MAG: GumC family protein [Janthinobacterium lividum]
MNKQEQDTSDSQQAQEASSLDVLLLLAARKRFLVWATLTAMLLGTMVAFLMKPTYTATATILPPQAPQSSLSSMLGQLGSLSALSGGASSLLKNPADLYVGILQSRTVANGAIQRFHLQQRWKARTMVAARKALASHAQFESAKDGMIQISVKEQDPAFASDLANFFVDALYHMNSTLAITEAAQRRLFFERQLFEEKSALAAAEEDLKATQQKTGFLTVTGQTELAVRNIAQTRAQISAREVELQSLRTYAAEDNPDVAPVKEALRTLRAQLETLENSQRAAGSPEIATSQVPESGLVYARKLREVKYHDTLFELLSRQYEAARIDEAKSAPIIQVVDRAEAPDQKSGPPRVLIIFGSSLVGFCFACAYLLAKAARHKSSEKPAIGSKLWSLKQEPWSDRTGASG